MQRGTAAFILDSAIGWCRDREIAVEVLILLVVGIGALVAFMAGIALLVLSARLIYSLT